MLGFDQGPDASVGCGVNNLVGDQPSLAAVWPVGHDLVCIDVGDARQFQQCRLVRSVDIHQFDFGTSFDIGRRLLDLRLVAGSRSFRNRLRGSVGHMFIGHCQVGTEAKAH